MATSYVSFDEGSTKKVRTFQRTDGSDTVEEWMYAQSESLFATYSVSAQGIAAATANSHLLEIMAGGSTRVGIKRITVYQVANATAAASFAFDVLRLTTAGTGGSAVTALPLDPASGAVGATAMTLPSSKGTEGTASGGRHRGTISTTAATVGLNPVLDLRFGENNTKPLYIAAGTSNGIVLKNPGADATATFDIYVEFVEASWA